MKNSEKITEITSKDLEGFLEYGKKVLDERNLEIAKVLVDAVRAFSLELDKKRVSVKRLKKILFGSKTEKTRNLFKNIEGDGDESSEDTSEVGNGSDTPASGSNGPETGSSEKKKEKRKGHGRNAAAAYTGAEREKVSHESLEPGDPCPEEGCSGKVYEQKKPRVLIRLTGQPPVGGTIYELQRLRCNLCGKVFTAKEPEEAGPTKCDETAASIIALLHYGSGLPFNRLEGLQRALGIPLPSTNQWEIMERLAGQLEPVYEEFIREAAQGDVVYNDDTTMKVLELIKENEERKENAKRAKENFG